MLLVVILGVLDFRMQGRQQQNTLTGRYIERKAAASGNKLFSHNIKLTRGAARRLFCRQIVDEMTLPQNFY
jgi:hypothetical protein